MEPASGVSYQLARGELNALIGEWGFEEGAEDEDKRERLADERLQALARRDCGKRELQEVVAALQKLK